MSDAKKPTDADAVKPCETVIPPIPAPMPEARRKELEAILAEQFKDGEDVADDEDEMNLYLPR